MSASMVTATHESNDPDAELFAEKMMALSVKNPTGYAALRRLMRILGGEIAISERERNRIRAEVRTFSLENARHPKLVELATLFESCLAGDA